LFSPPPNGSGQNSQSLLLFLFHSTEFQTFFSSVERFGTEFRQNKPIVPSIPSSAECWERNQELK
jgi:hypothetical protein